MPHRRFLRPAALSLCLLVGSVSFGQLIELKTGPIDPELQPQAAAEGGFYLLQLRSALTAADRAEMRLRGLETYGYVPANTFVVRLQPGDVAAARQWPRTRWLGRFLPAYKLSPDLGKIEFRTADRMAEARRGLRRLTVSLFPTMSAGPAVTRARGLGMRLLEQGRVGNGRLLTVLGTLAAARELAKVEEVSFISEAGEWSYRNDTTSWVIQSNAQGFRPIWDHGILGQGQVFGHIDGPVDINHYQFKDPNGNPIGPTHRKVLARFGAGGADAHGTHTAGTLTGDLEPMNGQTTNSGMAPKAKIVLTNLSTISGSNLYTSFVTQYNAGARLHTNSWGNDGTTSYDAWSQAIDQYSWDFEDAMVAFAVSNQSSLRNPENAKSVLAVGAANQAPNQGTVGYAGRGPTQDGRRKPEIFAPGVGIFSARAGTQTSFTTMSGTSMACPAITGAAALVRQYYMEGWLRDGVPNQNRAFVPSGALIRATLMNSTVDMSGDAGYPGTREGWGRLLLDNTLYFAGDSRRTVAWDIRNAMGLQAGQFAENKFIVQNGANPLKVTLTFTDYPGALFANPAYVNDVDLEVEAPDGTVYLGNAIDASTGLSFVGGTQDAKNSTEMVILANPTPGIWKVRGIVRALNQGAAQGFAIVANGSVLNLVPPSVKETLR